MDCASHAVFAQSSTGFVPQADPRWPLIVATELDGLWDSPDCLTRARAAFELLKANDVPVILSSVRSGSELREVRDAIGLPDPFICDGGSSVYIPTGYFDESPLVKPTPEFEVVTFGRARAHGSHAIRLLLSLYRACNPHTLAVGIGTSWSGRALLEWCDVPVVVGCGDSRDHRLIERFPYATVTHSVGLEGWTEAILGRSES